MVRSKGENAHDSLYQICAFESYIVPKGFGYGFLQTVVLMKILIRLRLRSDLLLKKLGSASLNRALVMPDSLSRHQPCGKENENFTRDV